MTADEMESILAALRWPHAYVARLLDCDARLVRRWGYGHAPIPPSVAAWLADCKRVAETVAWPAAPADWRVNPLFFRRPKRRRKQKA